MRSVTHKETVKAVEALGEVLKKTKGQLKPKQRSALVNAVLKTIATGKGPKSKEDK